VTAAPWHQTQQRSAIVDEQAPRIYVHTLGPTGTNCEAAAHHWLERRGHPSSQVVLHDSLEDALVSVKAQPANSVLLGCVVYPKLHEIVFQNLASLSLRDCFVFPTHNMVLAVRGDGPIESVLSHPAPMSLVDHLGVVVIAANSNSGAAEGCAAGEADGCITTLVAARANQLRVVEDFGPVPMGFTIHAGQQLPV
jgi:prephenate dehydratase